MPLRQITSRGRLAPAAHAFGLRTRRGRAPARGACTAKRAAQDPCVNQTWSISLPLRLSAAAAGTIRCGVARGRACPSARRPTWGSASGDRACGPSGPRQPRRTLKHRCRRESVRGRARWRKMIGSWARGFEKRERSAAWEGGCGTCVGAQGADGGVRRPAPRGREIWGCPKPAPGIGGAYVRRQRVRGGPGGRSIALLVQPDRSEERSERGDR
jgi:hypothetical protein